MLRALDIITDAYERMNRLSPGEALSEDDAAFGLRRLNLLVDELGAVNQALFLNTLTSAAQSGHITLGAGDWAALSPGDEVISAAANNIPMALITMAQFNGLYQPTVTGTPSTWAQDGLGTVYLWPVPNGQTIKLQTRSTVQAFADLFTQYTAPAGWQSALGAALAVRIAPTILGRMPPELIRAEAAAMGGVTRYEPAIVDVMSFSNVRLPYLSRLF